MIVSFDHWGKVTEGGTYFQLESYHKEDPVYCLLKSEPRQLPSPYPASKCFMLLIYKCSQWPLDERPPPDEM